MKYDPLFTLGRLCSCGSWENVGPEVPVTLVMCHGPRAICIGTRCVFYEVRPSLQLRACAPGCLVRLCGACAAAQPLSVCTQVQQPLIALLGSMHLALPAQLLSVCAQVQQPLIALLGSMVLALPAQLLCLPLSLSLLIHCVGKANMAGAAPVAQTLVRTKPKP